MGLIIQELFESLYRIEKENIKTFQMFLEKTKELEERIIKLEKKHVKKTNRSNNKKR